MSSNFNHKPPNKEKNYLTMLSYMMPKEDNFFNNCSPDTIISTSDLYNQLYCILDDAFSANITAEENFVLKLDFPNNQTFKLKLVTE